MTPGSMTPTLMNLIKGPAAALEAGMSAIQSALDATQKKLDEIVTQDSAAHLTQAPIQGPPDIDNALSDFAARAVRIVRYAPYDTAAVPAVSQELVAAAKKSFGYLDLKNPRNILFPAQLAVSASSLMAQSALRGLATFQVLGPVRIQPLIKDFVEMFTELPVFLGLEYKQVIERCRARLAEHPEDDKTRYELGQTLVKCGLYDQAEKELLAVSKESSYYADAAHEATVALYRAGRLERAARAGVLALQARPGHARTKSWLWLTAKKMGGYPDFVPESARINVTAGYAKPSVQFVDIAAKIGLDKTSAGRGIAIFDYDNDGYLDVLVAAAHGGCNFYHNNGDGTFTDVSIGTGMDTCVNGFAVTVGDYNNDGFTDVFVTRLGFYGGECQLFRNNGNGTFTDVTKEAGLKVWGPAFAAAWIDYDCDGHLDLFIANNLGGLFERKTPNRLFHNNGDGTLLKFRRKSDSEPSVLPIAAPGATTTMTATPICSSATALVARNSIATTATARLQTSARKPASTSSVSAARRSGGILTTMAGSISASSPGATTKTSSTPWNTAKAPPMAIRCGCTRTTATVPSPMSAGKLASTAAGAP